MYIHVRIIVEKIKIFNRIASQKALWILKTNTGIAALRQYDVDDQMDIMYMYMRYIK